MTGSSHKDFSNITLAAPYDITRRDTELERVFVKHYALNICLSLRYFVHKVLYGLNAEVRKGK